MMHYTNQHILYFTLPRAGYFLCVNWCPSANYLQCALCTRLESNVSDPVLVMHIQKSSNYVSCNSALDVGPCSRDGPREPSIY